jgi:hypothetical protein
LTKKHFERMAAIVRSILAGEWTHDCPPWAREDTQSPDYVQAVQIAEVLIMLASEDNPRFDTDRFLIACGLKAKPTQRTAMSDVRPRYHVDGEAMGLGR